MKAILFDLDGTVIDSSEGITKSVQYALESFGIQETDLTKLYPFIGPPVLDSFQKYYDFTQEMAEQAVVKYRERYHVTGCYESALFEGVEETLGKLKELGYQIGIASSKPEKFCKIILDYLGVLSLFDEVVGATEDGKINSKEQVLAEVFRRWEHIPKNEMCLVGDTIYDVEGANAHGIPCVGVSFGFGNVEKMKQAGAVAICDEFRQLLSIIETL